MPGTLQERHKLNDLPVAANREVARHREPVNLAIERVANEIQVVAKPPLDIRPTVLPGRHADGVDHQCAYGRVCRADIAIRRWRIAHPFEKTARRIYLHRQYPPFMIVSPPNSHRLDRVPDLPSGGPSARWVGPAMACRISYMFSTLLIFL